MSTVSPPAQRLRQADKFKVTAHEVYTGSFSDAASWHLREDIRVG